MVNFDKIYAISLLKKRPNKFNELLSRIPQNWGFGKIEPYEAIDGQLIDLPLWWNQKLKGSYGCYCSHVGILRNVIQNDYKNVMVLEDDAIFSENFTRSLKDIFIDLPNDWDQLYLGGQHLGRTKKISSKLVKGSNINRTHCYILNDKQAAQKILDLIQNKDFWITNLNKNKYHVDYAYGVLHQKGIINAYAAKPFIVGQLSNKYSDTGSQTSSVNRWWN